MGAWTNKSKHGKPTEDHNRKTNTDQDSPVEGSRNRGKNSSTTAWHMYALKHNLNSQSIILNFNEKNTQNLPYWKLVLSIYRFYLGIFLTGMFCRSVLAWRINHNLSKGRPYLEIHCTRQYDCEKQIFLYNFCDCYAVTWHMTDSLIDAFWLVVSISHHSTG